MASISVKDFVYLAKPDSEKELTCKYSKVELQDKFIEDFSKYMFYIAFVRARLPKEFIQFFNAFSGRYVEYEGNEDIALYSTVEYHKANDSDTIKQMVEKIFGLNIIPQQLSRGDDGKYIVTQFDWGPILWRLLHNATIQAQSDIDLKSEFSTWFMFLPKHMFCGICSQHMISHKPGKWVVLFTTHYGFIRGVYEFHNLVNVTKGFNGRLYNWKQFMEDWGLEYSESNTKQYLEK